MKQTLPALLAERRQNNRLKWLLLIGAGVLIVAASWLAIAHFQEGSRFNKQTLSPEQFAEQTGLQVTLIAVTSGGGMVDLRLKVVDADKAAQLFADPEVKPILIAEDGTELLPPAEMEFNVNLEADKAYFTLYGNPNNAIKRGSPVTVTIGGYRLEPIIAQ